MPLKPQELVLDPAIRDWVLGGLSLVMLLSGLIRHYVTMLLNTPPKPQPLLVVREQRALARGAILRTYGSYLAPSAFVALKSHLSDAYTSGFYLKAPPPADGSAPAPPPNPLMEPGGMDGMLDMVKKQAVQFLPQTILMYYIGYFYDGFVLTRLPFPLTLRFKSMLQRGIQTSDMDVSWVSSVSWYFLCLFGLNSIYRLILGEENAADGAQNMAAMNPMAGMMSAGASAPGQPPQDFFKLYKTEKDNLELAEYNWVCDGVEDRLLKKYA
ncbi:hypothetical protein MNV49_006903 [Pseudohyphozyma bogoriensis]|nr:hypothetical protein MNV49_006903 [Pseudohyphozyma bogoriensis]